MWFFMYFFSLKDLHYEKELKEVVILLTSRCEKQFFILIWVYSPMHSQSVILYCQVLELI